MSTRTESMTTALAADGKAATWTLDLSDPTNLPLTGKSKSHLAFSTGWTKDETTGLSYVMSVVLPFDRAAELAEMQAEADKPARPARTRKGATPTGEAETPLAA